MIAKEFIEDNDILYASQKTLVGHSDMVRNMAISIDDKLLASAGCHDCTAKIWCLKKGYAVKTILCAHENTVQTVVISESTKFMVTAGFDDAVKIWGL